MPRLPRLTLALVAGFGAIGALLRYGTGLALAPAFGNFPGATLVLNMGGSFLLGWIAFGWAPSGIVAQAWQKGVTTGLIGSYTTFSALSMDAVGLMQDGRFGSAALYVGISVVGGLAAAMCGAGLARRKGNTQ